MRVETRREAVAQLSGFLNAIASFSGRLRQYEAFSYFIEVNDEQQSLDGLINDYYRGQFEFSFACTKCLESVGDIEDRIKLYLIRDKSSVVEDRISDLQSYLSFRIMDMISEIFEKTLSELKAFELHEETENRSNAAAFFCITSGNLLVVLQFNSY
jgi:hypothetical protein